MKKILFCGIALGAMLLGSCAKDGAIEQNDDQNTNSVAWLALGIQTDTPHGVRASGSSEQGGVLEESTLNKLYMLTFNTNNRLVVAPSAVTNYVTLQSVTSPDPVMVSGETKKIVIIANPGTKMMALLSGVTAGVLWDDVNAAITAVLPGEVSDSNGYITMISSGDETGKTAGSIIYDPFVSVAGKIFYPASDSAADKTAASEKAKINRAKVKIERLTAKIQVKAPDSPTKITSKEDANATVELRDWTVDAVNNTFYPFAQKHIIAATHSTGGSYVSNFYTVDPNYTTFGGLEYATVDRNGAAPTFNVTLPFNNHYSWKTKGWVDNFANIAYVVENTMHKDEQKFANATRVVMRATYFPENFTPGNDWFRFAGINYPSLAALQTDPNASQVGTNLNAACVKFYQKVKAFKPSIAAANFFALTESDLLSIENAGDVVKDGKNPVIKWYKRGECYYAYEIRHDNDPNAGRMAFAKYGVVRNNWYKLTLKSVREPGTPWYPDVNDPGEGDPDPTDPIDNGEGYLGVLLEIAPWILWDTEMENV